MSSTTAALQVIEFVRALALAWKNLAAYPSGHPALLGSLVRVDQSLRELRGPAGEATFGVATDALFYGDLKIDALVAQKFAHALYSRGVAVLRFSSETTTADIEAFLRLLARGGARGPHQEPFGEALTASGVVNINVQSVHYSSIQVSDTLRAPTEQPQQPVWNEILRALLENRQFATGLREAPTVASVDELSRLLAEYAEAADEQMTFDPKATFGIRMASLDGTEHPLYRFLELTVGEQIAHAIGPRKQHSLEQALQLIRTLPHSLRETIVHAVIRALSSDETASVMLRHFAAELPNDEVLDALRYVSAMGPLSGHALSLLDSLTTIEASARAESLSPTVVADVVRLFGDDDPNRFNPAEYRNAVSTIAIRIPEVPEEALTSLEELDVRVEAVAETMPEFTRVLFDLLHDSSHSPGPALKRLEGVFRARLSRGQYAEAHSLVENLSEIATSALGARKEEMDGSIARLAAGDAIHELIERVHRATPEAAQQIQSLARALGTTAQRSLLSALANETSRSRRRRLFDFIVSFGPKIVPDVVPMLGDNRWYVVRNMVVLLRTLGDHTALSDIRPLARHDDLRVRLEAIKTLFALDTNPSPALLDDMFNDADAKVVEAAVGLVGSYGIKEAVQPLLRILEGSDIFGARRKLRIKAVRALGEIGDARALPHIERFLKTSILPWPSRDERYAAWESLQRYPAETRSALIERGRRSSDPQIRAICERLTLM